MAEIRIEEKKRGAPWLMIVVLLLVAAVIGWWLWSNRDKNAVPTESTSEIYNPAVQVAQAAHLQITPGIIAEEKS
jgi:predicted negative regulator of RcsB-dependent stress response